MSLTIMIQCPICGHREDVETTNPATRGEAPQCPYCFCDMFAVSTQYQKEESA